MRNINPALARAYELEQRGQLAEAISAYQRLLASEPNNSDALHLLGVALARAGRATEALTALAAAARLQADNPYIQLNFANALSAQGRDTDALPALERALALKPDLTPALLARGRAQLRVGQPQAAERGLAEAARLMPASAEVHIALGVALERLDRKSEALQQFARATVLNPNSAEAHHNLGLLQALDGKLRDALASLDRALQLEPRQAAIHANRGNVLADLSRSGEALASFDRALALAPRSADVLRSRGKLLLQQQQPVRALADFDAALRLEPQDHGGHLQRGIALTLLERHAEALESFERALAIEPGSAEVLNNRAVALSNLSRLEEAMDGFRSVLTRDPQHLQALTNGANTLTTLRRYDEALEWFTRALALRPEDPQLAWGKSRLLLSLGDFRQGWPLHEARLMLPHLRPLQRHVDLPRWKKGEPIAGKTLLVYAEQGLGDTLQFCRLVPLVEARGATVIFEVQPALQRLLLSLQMQGEVIAAGEPLPPFELSSPLLSLPYLLDADCATSSAAFPYLQAEPRRVVHWRERLATLPGLKVGIAWQGNVETEKQGGFAGRSFRLASAAPLAQLRDVSLVSLQKGAGAEQLAQVDFAARVFEPADPWEMGAEEILDTAALTSALDLVITSDTATAHLAGALGVPTWVLLAANADWRWLLDRPDSPWYPTIRLFRQRDAGQWEPLFAQVARELALFAQGHPGRPVASG